MGTAFDDKFLESQKDKLLLLKQEVINSMSTKSLEDIQVPTDQIVEDGDQAQTYIEQNVSLGLRERDLNRLKEIEHALAKIEKGTYGYCEETDEPIEKKRLEKMPWTRLCIEAAEDLERNQKQHYRATS